MQIKRCTISNQKLFDNTAFNLSDSINIIYGKNGSGKSFLARALIDSLWKITSPDTILSSSTWENLFVEVMYSLSPFDHFKMTCNRSNRSILSYVTNDSTISLPFNTTPSPEETDDISRIKLKMIKEFYKHMDCQTYVQSSFLPSPADLENDSSLDYQSIKDVILNDQSRFYSLFINLNGKGPAESHNNNILSEILKHEGRIKEITKNIRIIDIQNSRNDKLTEEKKKITREIDSMRKTLSTMEAQKAIYLDIKKSLLDTEKLHEKLNTIKEEVENEQEKTSLIDTMKKEINEQFPEFQGLDIDNTENLNKLQEIFNEARNINESIDKFYSKKKRVKDILKKLVATLNVAYITVIALLLYTGTVISDDNMHLWGGGLGIVALVSFLLLFIPSVAKGTKKIESLNNRKKEVSKEMQSLAAKIKISKESFNISELYEFLLQYFEDYIEYSEKTREMLELQQSLKSTNYLEKIEDDLEALKIEEEFIQKIIDENLASLSLAKDIKLDPDEIDDTIDDMESRIDALNKEIDSKDKIIAQIEIEMSQAPDEENGELDNMLDEKKETEKILKDLYDKSNTHKYVTELLSHAVEKSEERQLERLVHITMDRFNFLTSNQYISKIDGSSIQKFISDYITPPEMNPTSIHYLVLSIKMALTEYLAASGLSIPLIMDDPFIFMDEEKIQNMKQLVLDISRKRQVIIFTHKNISQDWGNYITL